MALTLAHLFDEISGSEHPDRYEVSMSYLEIYNENIRDLLNPTPDFLDLREDYGRGVVVAGITYQIATSAEQVLEQLRKGNRNRTQEATGANEVSSRSHAVLQVFVGCRMLNRHGVSTERFGKLSMIDLAGSERAAETSNRGIRMIEGANINRSLLALGNCINALTSEAGRKGKFVNYRDSKLTRLLKDSLGGNCRTVMIANISPSSHNFDETVNTLKYASRARAIKTKFTQQASHKIDPHNAAILHVQSDIGSIKNKLSHQTHSHQAGEHGGGHNRAPSNQSRGGFKSKAASKAGTPATSFLGGGGGGGTGVGAMIGFDEGPFLELKDMLDHLFDEDFQTKYPGEGTQAEKIRTVIQNLPRSLHKRSRQYLELMAKKHFLELEGRSWKNKATILVASLNHRDVELTRIRQQLGLLENISSTQRNLLQHSKIKIPPELQESYHELDALTKTNGNSKSSAFDTHSTATITKTTIIPASNNNGQSKTVVVKESGGGGGWGGGLKRLPKHETIPEHESPPNTPPIDSKPSTVSDESTPQYHVVTPKPVLFPSMTHNTAGKPHNNNSNNNNTKLLSAKPPLVTTHSNTNISTHSISSDSEMAENNQGSSKNGNTGLPPLPNNKKQATVNIGVGRRGLKGDVATQKRILGGQIDNNSGPGPPAQQQQLLQQQQSPMVSAAEKAESKPGKAKGGNGALGGDRIAMMRSAYGLPPTKTK